MTAFNAGQRRWSAVQDVPGFVSQVGGRSLRYPGLVHILACWDGETVYRDFMRGGHDTLADAQAGTYRDVHSRLFALRGGIPDPSAAHAFAVSAGSTLEVTFLPSVLSAPDDPAADLVEIDPDWTVIAPFEPVSEIRSGSGR